MQNGSISIDKPSPNDMALDLPLKIDQPIQKILKVMISENEILTMANWC